MSETPQPNSEAPSMYKQYETATAKYYGSDKDPFKYAPVAEDKDVAHELALQVERQLSNIDEADVIKQAVQARKRYKPMMRDPQEITDYVEAEKQSTMDHKLRLAVTNVETSHASLAPEDFNEDSMQAGAYQQGTGISIPRPREQ